MKTPRSPRYLAFIRLQRCAVCRASAPSEAAHVRMGNGGGMALKPSDFRTVPLCRACHAYQHQIGERSFWEEPLMGQPPKDPDLIAARLLCRFAIAMGRGKETLRALELILIEGGFSQ